jgi:hypothetical protein
LLKIKRDGEEPKPAVETSTLEKKREKENRNSWKRLQHWRKRERRKGIGTCARDLNAGEKER